MIWISFIKQLLADVTVLVVSKVKWVSCNILTENDIAQIHSGTLREP